jgi:hypothetical protein
MPRRRRRARSAAFYDFSGRMAFVASICGSFGLQIFFERRDFLDTSSDVRRHLQVAILPRYINSLYSSPELSMTAFHV